MLFREFAVDGAAIVESQMINFFYLSQQHIRADLSTEALPTSKWGRFWEGNI